MKNCEQGCKKRMCVVTTKEGDEACLLCGVLHSEAPAAVQQATVEAMEEGLPKREHDEWADKIMAEYEKAGCFKAPDSKALDAQKEKERLEDEKLREEFPFL